MKFNICFVVLLSISNIYINLDNKNSFNETFLISLENNNLNSINFNYIKLNKEELISINKEKYLYKIDVSGSFEAIDKWVDEVKTKNFVRYIENDVYGSKASSSDLTYMANQTHLSLLEIQDVWKYTQGDSSITVGVIDTGIEGTHKELIDNIDSDLSESFVDNSSPLIDYVGHGTHVAGIIGASGNYANIKGIAPKTKLASLKITDTDGEGSWPTSNIVRAINYANENNINILNFSGYKFGFSQSFEEAIKNYKGLFVCISGNDSENLDSSKKPYPAKFNLDNMIVVGNSQDNGNIYYKSNYSSKYVNLFAPGVNIFSTHLNGTYKQLTGSSMSAPMVAGTVALLKSIYPNKSNSFIKNRILNNIDVNSDLATKCSTSGNLNIVNSIHKSCSYDVSYLHKDSKYHNAYCVCGKYIQEGHTVASGSFSGGKLYSTCLYCGGKAEMGFETVISLNDNLNEFELINNKYYIKETNVIDGVLYLSYKDFINYEY